jgi:uncharacterized membrane protein YgcG
VNALPPAWQTGAQADANQSSSARMPAMTFKGALFSLGLVMIVVLVVLVIGFGRKYRYSEPEGAFARVITRLFGWPLIILGLLTFMGGAILATGWGLPLYLVFGAVGIGMLTFLAGGLAQGQNRGGSSSSSSGGDWGGGDFGGGGGSGGGGSDFG